MDLLLIDGAVKGFVEYQIDNEKSDWCERPGWGTVREIYVRKDLRGKGYGKMLVNRAEEKLKKLSGFIDKLYLTADGEESIKFWLHNGYRDTGEICAKNDGKILIKNIKK